MKKLYLLRHAKSSWEDSYLEDFHRPLNNRGKNQIKVMKDFISKNKIEPELILCSTASRTILTYNGIFSGNETIFMDNLYHATSQEIMDIIKNVDKDINSLLIIGHNPGLNEFASELVGYQSNIQTCSLLEIEISIKHWYEINTNNSKFVSYTNPPKKE